MATIRGSHTSRNECERAKKVPSNSRRKRYGSADSLPVAKMVANLGVTGKSRERGVTETVLLLPLEDRGLSESVG